MLSISKQEFQSLKERNLSLKENFKNVLTKEKATKKFKEFMTKQVDILFNDLDDNIDNLIAKGKRSLEPSDKVDHDAENGLCKMQHPDQSIIGNLINSPGLNHLAENIFLNLDNQVLETCRNVNTTFQQFLDDPMFWVKRFIQRGLSKKNQDDWTEAIQMTRDGKVEPDLERNILLFLKRYSRNEKVVDFDVPCYLNDKKFLKKAPELITSFFCNCNEKVKKSLMAGKMIDNDDVCNCISVIKKFLKPFGKKPKRPKLASSKYEDDEDDVTEHCEDKNTWTIFHDAAEVGNPAVIQLLAPLAVNPNSANRNGRTPIYLAAQRGNSDVIKVLAPLTDSDPNDSYISLENPHYSYYGNQSAAYPKENGRKPMHAAAIIGNVEIIKILAPFTDNPNPEDDSDLTPIDIAVDEGHLKIVQILVSLGKNPLLSGSGRYPRSKSLQNAIDKGYVDMVKVLAPFANEDQLQEELKYLAKKDSKEHQEIAMFLKSLQESRKLAKAKVKSTTIQTQIQG